MATPLYNKEAGKKTDTSHKGLWFDRFFDKYDNSNDWEIIKAKKNEDSSGMKWVNSASGNCGNKIALERDARAKRALCIGLSGKIKIFKNDWHFVTGMGNPHPVENGMAWHPTLGTPYLTGAAVKGLLRAWIEQWSGLEGQALKDKLFLWFGSDDKSPEKRGQEAQAGGLIFFDALPIKPVTLKADIMTPHMGDWYSDGDIIQNEPSEKKSKGNYADTLPADWHNPIPIPFLVVSQASLQFCIAPRPFADISEDEVNKAMKALEMALEYLGAGAKTATGYGLFRADANENSAVKTEMDEKKNQQADAERTKGMSPLELELDKINQSSDNPATALLHLLDEAQYTAEDKKIIAQKTKEAMDDGGQWMPNFTGTNKKKIKLKDRSQKVLTFLGDAE